MLLVRFDFETSVFHFHRLCTVLRAEMHGNSCLNFFPGKIHYLNFRYRNGIAVFILALQLPDDNRRRYFIHADHFLRHRVSFALSVGKRVRDRVLARFVKTESVFFCFDGFSAIRHRNYGRNGGFSVLACQRRERKIRTQFLAFLFRLSGCLEFCDRLHFRTCHRSYRQRHCTHRR